MNLEGKGTKRKSNYVRALACVIGVCLLMTLMPLGIAQAATIESWDFTAGANNGWMGYNVTFALGTGCIAGTIGGANPCMYSPTNLNYSASSYPIISICFQNNTAATTGHLYFITVADQTMNTSKLSVFPIKANDPGFTTYTIDMSTVSTWTGTISRLRFDPGDSTSGTFNLKTIKCQNDGAANMFVYNGSTAVDNLNQLTASGSISAAVNLYADTATSASLVLGVFKNKKQQGLASYSTSATALTKAQLSTTGTTLTMPSNLTGCKVVCVLWNDLKHATPISPQAVILQ